MLARQCTPWITLSKQRWSTLRERRCYARVSTTDQDCGRQLRELREYVIARGWENAAEFVDAGFSGSKSNRPELTKLMQHARKRQIDAVAVLALDRWGRSAVDCVTSIQELNALGVRFIAVSQGIDTDQGNPIAKFVTHIMAALAEMERELIRERVKSGIANARAKGKQIGRPKRVLRRDKMLEMRAAGASWRAIAKEMNVAHSTVRFLRRASAPRRVV